MNILIVDDNLENLDMMQILLQSRHYNVESATNGKEALDKLKNAEFDMIISDILMPVMDGFQLCKECRIDEKLWNIYFVFYTATYIDEKDEELALSLGAQKFIRKPQEPETFLNIIKEIISSARFNHIDNAPLSDQEEKDVLKLYSERLINKLEKKNLALKSEIQSRIKIEKELKEYKEHLEELVKLRTKELEERNKALLETNQELERVNKLFVDREFRIKELRDKIHLLEIKNQ